MWYKYSSSQAWGEKGRKRWFSSVTKFSPRTGMEPYNGTAEAKGIVIIIISFRYDQVTFPIKKKFKCSFFLNNIFYAFLEFLEDLHLKRTSLGSSQSFISRSKWAILNDPLFKKILHKRQKPDICNNLY